MQTKFIGLIGAGGGSTLASRAHFPALAHCPDFELTAVCTTKPEGAEAARKIQMQPSMLLVAPYNMG